MGPEDEMILAGKFSERIPPSFDGNSNYQSYRTDVLLWCQLTSLDATKRGPALIGQLSSEAKNLAKNLPMDVICSQDGIKRLLSRLDDSYGTDESDQLDRDLAEFLMYTWQKDQSVDQYIVGFNARLDKVAEVNFSDKVKGHIMLRQASLDLHDRSIIIGAASGKFEIKHISNALRATYREHQNPPSSSTMNTRPAISALRPIPIPSFSRIQPNNNTLNYDSSTRNWDSRDKKEDIGQDMSTAKRPTFLSYPSFQTRFSEPMAILDTGACASIVGKDTLDRFMQSAGLTNLVDVEPRQSSHRFGQHPEELPTLGSVKVPFSPLPMGNNAPTGFDIAFDIIAGDLPFLVGLPSLEAMNANINFIHLNLGIRLNNSYKRYKLVKDSSHLLLPLSPQELPVNKPSPQKPLYLHQGSPGSIAYYTPSPLPDSHPTKFNYESVARPLANQLAIHTTYLDNTTQLTPPRTHDSNHRAHHSSIPVATATLNVNQIKKLHLQLRHGSISDMISYLRKARVWNEALRTPINTVVNSCDCMMAAMKPPHPVASASPPISTKQSDVAVDVIKLGPSLYLHVVDKATGWSEVGKLYSKALSVQCRLFHRIQTLRHGPPVHIYGDQEYNKPEFLNYCAKIDATFIDIPANAHQSNGSVERANRTLRSFFNRIRTSDKRSSNDDVVAEATYGKNICQGKKIGSSFELIYGNPPRIMTELPIPPNPRATVSNHSARIASNRLNRMLRSSIRVPASVEVGESILFWRDSVGWIGPVTVSSVDKHQVKFMHNKRLKTASLSYVRKIPLDPTRIDNYEGNDRPFDTPDSPESSTHDESEEDHNASDLEEHLEPSPPPVEATTPSDRAPHEQSEPIVISQNSIDTDHLERDIESPLIPEAPSFGNGDPHKASRSIDKSNAPSNSASKHKTPDPQHLRRKTRGIDELRREADKFISNPNYVSPSAHSKATCDPITDSERLKAYMIEKENWISNHAYIEIDPSQVPTNKNVIGSHVIFKRKDDGRVKARIVPWGHRDSHKNEVRGDAPSMNVDMFRLLFSLAAQFGWKTGQMDVKAAFLQALGFQREIYVKPPKEDQSNKWWLLTAAAYGLKDSGRLWYLTSDAALTSKLGLVKSRTENALYFRHHDERLVFALVTQVDNYIYAGVDEELARFERFLHMEFEIGELDRRQFNVMGCFIDQSDDGSITVSQPDKMKDLSERDLVASIKDLSGTESAMPQHVSEYKSVIGQMLFIGRLSNPPLLYQASHMATKTNDLRIHHLRDLQAIVNAAAKTQPKVQYQRIHNKNMPTYLHGYSDAAMCGKKDNGARGGFLIVRRFGDIVHPIAWSARKLKRVARSSATAELLAAADATSHLIYLQTLLGELVGHSGNASSHLTVDSLCLFKLATSTKEPQEARNKVDLASIRESFSPNLLRAIEWQPGNYHAADCLTKDNKVSSALMIKIFREGTYPTHPDTLTTIAEADVMTPERHVHFEAPHCA